MTVQSVQQIGRQPEWNQENKTAKATQPKFCLPQHNTDHVQLKAWPNLAPTPADYIAATVLCVHKQLPGCTCTVQ